MSPLFGGLILVPGLWLPAQDYRKEPWARPQSVLRVRTTTLLVMQLTYYARPRYVSPLVRPDSQTRGPHKAGP